MTDEKSDLELIVADTEKQTGLGIFHLNYLSDERYLTSPNRENIEQLNLPELFVAEAEKVAKDLGITQSLEVVVEIPGDDPETNHIIESLGIGARTLSDKVVVFQLDPYNPKILESLAKRQTRQIAHEFNHLARWELPGETLFDALIFEGLATSYEETWGGEHLETPWGKALSPEQLQTEWKKAQKELNSKDYDYHGWFFGTGDHPNWAGYTLGAAIVRNYRRLHPNIPMKELVRKPSEIFLEGIYSL